jgi:hypothetical protein
MSVSDPARSAGYVFVSYKGYMVLRIETAATDRVADIRPTSPTKLTSQSVAELVELANQCEVLCPTDRRKSGEDSPLDSEAKS